eukprot:TRINITY_DN4815_c0_g1_i1.p1 TRINITY_DN4815_c0_g1~~TRINITY_DN4815_c0_g1_i1.p1  ORF type:complete len:204 (+),score=49.89 TRINITY_DN4815_c0_g1_i1:85-696(+)
MCIRDRSSCRTAGIPSQRCSISDRIELDMVDVGCGQWASSRRREAAFVDGVEVADMRAVLVMVGLSDFDVQSSERREPVNKLVESLELVRSIASLLAQLEQEVPLVLVLSKADLFQDKVRAGRDIRVCQLLKEYPGGSHQVTAAMDFVRAVIRQSLEGMGHPVLLIEEAVLTDSGSTANTLDSIYSHIMDLRHTNFNRRSKRR